VPGSQISFGCWIMTKSIVAGYIPTGVPSPGINNVYAYDHYNEGAAECYGFEPAIHGLTFGNCAPWRWLMDTFMWRNGAKATSKCAVLRTPELQLRIPVCFFHSDWSHPE